MGIKIIIGGDFFVSPDYLSENLFSDDLIQLFNESDINVVNLESPVISSKIKEKIAKSGPSLHTNNQIFKHLKKLRINVVTLANNHILDYCSEGLLNTINECKQHSILTTGVGEDIKSASETLFIEKNGSRIAFVNFCENEFSIATENVAGANPLDIINNLAQIKAAKTKADYVIVIIHGGHEYYNLPSPRMVKQYRFFAENGADAVIGHHTHCISGFEIHKQIPIFYGLGNMIFTQHSSENGWYTGLLLKLELIKGTPVKWELIPIKQSEKNFLVSGVNGIENEKIMNEISSYSSTIIDSELLYKSWQKYIQTKETQYLNVFSPINLVPGRYLRAILRRMGMNNFIFRKKYVIPILNSIACEAHHDLSRAILHRKVKK